MHNMNIELAELDDKQFAAVARRCVDGNVETMEQSEIISALTQEGLLGSLVTLEQFSVISDN